MQARDDFDVAKKRKCGWVASHASNNTRCEYIGCLHSSSTEVYTILDLLVPPLVLFFEAVIWVRFASEWWAAFDDLIQGTWTLSVEASYTLEEVVILACYLTPHGRAGSIISRLPDTVRSTS